MLIRRAEVSNLIKFLFYAFHFRVDIRFVKLGLGFRQLSERGSRWIELMLCSSFAHSLSSYINKCVVAERFFFLLLLFRQFFESNFLSGRDEITVGGLYTSSGLANASKRFRTSKVNADETSGVAFTYFQSISFIGFRIGFLDCRRLRRIVHDTTRWSDPTLEKDE